MNEPPVSDEFEIDVSHLVTEDDTPVDNWGSEKQQRLAAKTLFTSYKRDNPFVVGVDIGIFTSPDRPAIVPDMLMALDSKLPQDWWAKHNRSYFVWKFGKSPELVIEIVSNKEGGELEHKLDKYANMGIWYYVVFDPQLLIADEQLQVYELRPGHFALRDDNLLYWLDLGVVTWEGTYEGVRATYFRFTDIDGNLLLNDEEMVRAQKTQVQLAEAKIEVERTRTRAETEKQRADAAMDRAALLAERLRQLGIDPDSI